MRMDAHVVYPRDYVSRLVEAMDESGADCVGGVIETLPADQTAIARAIALGLSHPFGVGNAYFRIGARQRRWADAVSFGCYRREVFDRIGLFDEDLVRNQDDEFDLRLSSTAGVSCSSPRSCAPITPAARCGSSGGCSTSTGTSSPSSRRSSARS